MEKELERELKNLVKQLRRQATQNCKKIGKDYSHYEGMCKGLYLGYEEAAGRLDKIIRARPKNIEPEPAQSESLPCNNCQNGPSLSGCIGCCPPEYKKHTPNK